MTAAKESENTSTGRRTKVAQLIEEYGLSGIGAELERRWTTDGEDRMSLRDLATYFNQRLLEEAMNEAGIKLLSGELENTYRLLTDDDVSGAERTRTIRQLKRKGVDVDALRDDFVTYQAIRSYLKGDRDAEYVRNDRNQSVAENVQRLRGRLGAVTKEKLEQLQTAGEITLGDFNLFVNVNVFCQTCGQQYEIDDLLEQGGCDCEKL